MPDLSPVRVTIGETAGSYPANVVPPTGLPANTPNRFNARVVATGNISLSGTPVIDGYQTVVGDRVLAIGQTTASANGVYVVAATGSWQRAIDLSLASQFAGPVRVSVELGTVGRNKTYEFLPSSTVVIGTTSLVFTEAVVSWDDPDLAGETAIPLVAYVKGPILLTQVGAITEGAGISAGARFANRVAIYNGAIAAGTSGRPLVFPKNSYVAADGDNGGIPIATDNVAIDLNGSTLSHDSTNNTTLMNVSKGGGVIIKNFSIRNGTMSGNAQNGKTASFYILGGDAHTGTVIEDVTFQDPFDCGLHFSDSYATPGRPYPNMVSSNMRVLNCKTVRTAANVSYIATRTAMREGDQAVLTHIDGLLIDGYYGEVSGRSGISILGNNTTIRRARFKNVAVPIYCESLTGFVFEDIAVEGHEHWWVTGAISSLDTAAIWLADADQSGPVTLGFGSCRDGIISNVRIANVTRSSALADYKGIRITGRDGASRGAQNIRVSDVTARAMTGGLTGPCAVSLEGLLTNVAVAGVAADNAPIAVRMNQSYTTNAGVAANLMTGCTVSDVTATACGYALYGPGGDPPHVKTIVNGVNAGGSALALVDSIALQGYTP